MEKMCLSSLDVVEVVLVQCNLVDNQFHQISEVLHIFMQNKSKSYTTLNQAI